MIDLKWAVLVGGHVIKKSVWESIPPDTRKVLEAAADVAGHEIQENGRKEGEQAIAAMVKRGLKVHRLTPELEARWVVAAEESYPKIRGTIVPADIFDEVQRLLKEYRATRK
jgi:TRAP-type C4-dicarboxylate transport system substrate-binding protein